jgi:hypothetical protein
MKRSQFIKGVAASAIALKFNNLFAKENTNYDWPKVVEANNLAVSDVLKSTQGGIKTLRRSLGFDLANLAAGFVEKTSKYYQKEELKVSMKVILDFIISQQKSDGTLDLGNLASPPDTAFIIEPICAAGYILKGNQECTEINALIKTIIEKSGAGLAIGGLHTPNHRWVVSAALAKINHLYPHPKYIKRINEWLSEGVYCDKDGVYLERSMTYAEVIDRSLITIATYTNKPELLKMVKRNLHWVYECMEPNGDLVTFASRRQDAFMQKNILLFYPQYRFMANKFEDGFMGSVAAFIEKMPGFEPTISKDLLYLFLEDDVLARNYPTMTLPKDFQKFYEGINLVRGRKNDETFSLFGGADWPIIIASGRSTNPSFFSFQKGKAALKDIRMSSSFFSTGFFRSQGIKKVGSQYHLYQKIEAPYYQPLPDKFKKSDGDYELSQSVDGRFWNKMDFKNRPKSNVSVLEYKVIFEEIGGEKVLKFDVSGTNGVLVVIELTFAKGGKLLGCESISGSEENFSIKEKEASYEFEGDKITFGPGEFAHQAISNMEGEMYSTHFGSLRSSGLHVFVTGRTPFVHTMKIS